MPPLWCSTITRLLSSGFQSTRPLPTSRAAPISLVHLPKLPAQSATACGRSLACRYRSAWRAPSIWRKLPRNWPTVTVRVRFANLDSSTRSVTLDAPISATMILAEIAEELVRAILADHPDEKTISLLAISVSHLEEHWDMQLELPLGLNDEARRPGTKKGMARWAADCAVDRIRDRFGWDAIGYASVMLGISRSVPD